MHTIMGQDAVHNYGNLQIHESTMVGFYNENNALTISGAFIPIFYDTEVAITDGLYLESVMAVDNNLNFIHGNMYTPRNQSDIGVQFSEQAFYVSEGMNTKMDGYASAINKDDFTFPVGMTFV